MSRSSGSLRPPGCVARVLLSAPRRGEAGVGRLGGGLGRGSVLEVQSGGCRILGGAGDGADGGRVLDVDDRVGGKEPVGRGDDPDILADPHASRLAVDDPRADDGVHRLTVVVDERRRWHVSLHDVVMRVVAVVVASRDRLQCAVPIDLDAGPFAREDRLLDSVGQVCRLLALEPGGDEVLAAHWVVAEQLPQERQNRLVAPEHLVRRFEPDGAADVDVILVELADVVHVGEDRLAPWLIPDPFPWVEHEADVQVLTIHPDCVGILVRIDTFLGDVEPAVVAELEVVDDDLADVVAGRQTGVHKVRDRDLVLTHRLAGAVGEVDGWLLGGIPVAVVVQLLTDLSEVALPSLDQPVPDGVPLVDADLGLVAPLPLGPRRLDKSGRGLSVELVGPRHGAGPCVVEVEASVDALAGRLVGPGVEDRLVGELRDAHLVAHERRAPGFRQCLDPVAGLLEHLEDLGSGLLKGEHLHLSEGVVHTLPPVVVDGAVLVHLERVRDAVIDDEPFPALALVAQHASHVCSFLVCDVTWS